MSADAGAAERHPGIAELHAYWQSKRPSPEQLPGRRSIDAAEMPRLLPHIVLWDVVDDGTDFRCRLAGGAVEECYGRGLKGILFSEILRIPTSAVVVEAARAIIANRSPNYRRWRLLAFDRAFVEMERILLPLAADGTNVDMLLGGYWEVKA